MQLNQLENIREKLRLGINFFFNYKVWAAGQNNLRGRNKILHWKLETNKIEGEWNSLSKYDYEEREETQKEIMTNLNI